MLLDSYILIQGADGENPGLTAILLEASLGRRHNGWEGVPNAPK
jgi:hypothetical protein